MIRINNILFFKNIFQFFFYPIMLRFFNIQYYTYGVKSVSIWGKLSKFTKNTLSIPL